MYKYFLGLFNKALNHRDCEYLKNECGIDYYFDEEFYNEIACQIKNILGNFEVYRVQDAFHYFQSQYAAYPIDIRYYYNYIDTSIITGNSFKRFTLSNDSDIDILSEPCGSFYSYVISENDKNDSSQEETLFLVIDLMGNRFLRERYPEISAREENIIQTVKGIQKDNEGVNWLNCGNKKISCVINKNIIIAIGSFDGVHINSMKILSGEKVLPQIDYELEFFRRYS